MPGGVTGHSDFSGFYLQYDSRVYQFFRPYMIAVCPKPFPLVQTKRGHLCTPVSVTVLLIIQLSRRHLLGDPLVTRSIISQIKTYLSLRATSSSPPPSTNTCPSTTAGATCLLLTCRSAIADPPPYRVHTPRSLYSRTQFHSRRSDPSGRRYLRYHQVESVRSHLPGSDPR